MEADENDKTQEAVDDDAVDPERERLWRATQEQFKIGPKGLYPDTAFDLSEWRKYARQYVTAMCTLADASVLYWCRVHLSVVTVTSDTALVHYSFENLYDGELPLNVDGYLFDTLGRIGRLWLKEDITTAQTSKEGLPWTGVTSWPKRMPVLYLQPSEILTITTKACRGENGVWPICHFGASLPGHTYKFQLIYGGLPSNVFTWTAPD